MWGLFFVFSKQWKAYLPLLIQPLLNLVIIFQYLYRRINTPKMKKRIYLLFKKIKEFNYKKLFCLLFKKIKEFKNKNEIALTFLVPYISILALFWDERWSDNDANLYLIISSQLINTFIAMIILVLISFFIAFMSAYIVFFTGSDSFIGK